jgi:hypothetical protein
MSRRRPMACHDCDVDTSTGTGISHYYMVWDQVWERATRGDARVRWLCLECLEARLGSPLRAIDFMVTPSELAERIVTGEEHTVLRQRERQRWLDYWRAVPRHRVPN